MPLRDTPDEARHRELEMVPPVAESEVFYNTPDPPTMHFRIQSVGNDHLTCYRCDPDGTNMVEVNEYVLHAPPLRRTLWDTLTIGGITYTYTTAIARSADNGVDDAEAQVVTPDYETPAGAYDGEIIKATRLEKRVAISGVGTAAYEEIADGRCWAPECS